MYEYDEFTDIVGCSCTLLIPYRGRTEGYVVADYGNDIVVKLHNGKEIVERREDVLVYDWYKREDNSSLFLLHQIPFNLFLVK